MENKGTEMPEELVNLKISYCGKCDGVVRTAVEHMMSKESKKEFALEAMEHNLTIKTISLIEYRVTKLKWCECR